MKTPKHARGCKIKDAAEFVADHRRRMVVCKSCGAPMGDRKEARQAYEAQVGAISAMRRVSRKLGLDVIR